MRSREIVYVSTPEQREEFVQWRSQQLDRAMVYWRADDAEVTRKEEQWNKEYADRLTKRGDCAQDYGCPDEAIYWYEKSIEIYTRLNESHGISLTLVKLASVHIGKGDLAVGLEFALKALPYYEADANDAKMGSFWASICADRLIETAKVCQLLHRYEQAESLFGKAFQLRIRNAHPSDKFGNAVTKVLELRADNLREAGQYRKAQAIYVKLLEIAKDKGQFYEAHRVECASRLAHIYLLQGRRNSAQLLLLQVQDEFESMAKRWGRSFVADLSQEFDELTKLAFDEHSSQDLSNQATPYKYGFCGQLVINRKKPRQAMTIEDIAADWSSRDKCWECIDSPEMAVEGLLTYGGRNYYAQAEQFIRSTLERNDFMVGKRFQWLKKLCTILSWHDRFVELREASLESFQLYRKHSEEELKTLAERCTTQVDLSALARHLEESGCLVEALEVYRADYQSYLQFYKPEEQTMIWRMETIQKIERRIQK